MQMTIGYAAHHHNTPLVPFSFERRALTPTDVQIEILFCGVCQSDIHQVRNDCGNSVFPMVPGHEIVGKVIKLGSEVSKFKAGDSGGTNYGGYSRQIVVDQDFVLHISDKLNLAA